MAPVERLRAIESSDAPPHRPHGVRRLGAALVVAMGFATSGSPFVGRAPPEACADETACDRLVERGEALLAEGEKENSPEKCRAAAKLFLQAEKLCPDGPLYPFWTGRAYVYAGDFDEATAANGRVARLSAVGDVYATWLAAEIHLKLGSNPDEAIAGFLRVRSRNPAFLRGPLSILLWRAYLDTGNHFVKGREFEEGIKRYQHALSEAGSSEVRAFMARANLAQAYRFADQWEQAEAMFVELVKQYPNEHPLRYSLASTFSDQLKFAEASEQWTIVIKALDAGQVAPADVATMRDARMRYGVCLWHLLKPKEAVAELLRYAKDVPDDPRVYGYLGDVENKEFEHFDKAAEYFEKAYAMDPFCERYMKELIRLYSTVLDKKDRAAELQKLFDDEGEKAKRKVEMKRRERTREDATDGCNR